jgi:hypothetical protein
LVKYLNDEIRVVGCVVGECQDATLDFLPDELRELNNRASGV